MENHNDDAVGFLTGFFVIIIALAVGVIVAEQSGITGWFINLFA